MNMTIRWVIFIALAVVVLRSGIHLPYVYNQRDRAVVLERMAGCYRPEGAQPGELVRFSRDGILTFAAGREGIDITRDKAGESLLPMHPLNADMHGRLYVGSGPALKLRIDRDGRGFAVFQDEAGELSFRRRTC